MTPDAILNKVCDSIDVLVEAGKPYGGLFPSLLDFETHRMLTELPPPIHGQRMGDRAFPGSNLMHDQHVLKIMYALDRDGYRDAADRYLRRFAVHCTDTVTGLFPWGEHAYWHLEEDRVGDSHRLALPDKAPGTTLHDHLRQAPVWLWEKLHGFNPRCVERFAEGLDYHYKDGEPREYIRHAHVERRERLERGAASSDFPRHGGFYILDWSFAYRKLSRADFLKQVEIMLDYWWPHRDPSGLLPSMTRGPEAPAPMHSANTPAQTVSLAASLLEAAELLDGSPPVLIDRMRKRARAYIGGFLSAPHDPDAGVFVSACRRRTNEVVNTNPVWGSVYGNWPLAYVALIALCIYRLTEDERLLDWAEGAARWHSRTPFPEGVPVPAMDAGLAIELLADLYDLTRDAAWLERGLKLARTLIPIYMDGELVRGAAGIDWYESQMVPGDLLHGMSRLALLATHGDACSLTTNYTAK
ncbi:MAG: hypothetical protein OXU79_10400 [Gemmatimonadota bacterium]|nr:hypothetical protein [Gemmatimonadota bacterium]